MGIRKALLCIYLWISFSVSYLKLWLFLVGFKSFPRQVMLFLKSTLWNMEETVLRCMLEQ